MRAARIFFNLSAQASYASADVNELPSLTTRDNEGNVTTPLWTAHLVIMTDGSTSISTCKSRNFSISLVLILCSDVSSSPSNSMPCACAEHHGLSKSK